MGVNGRMNGREWKEGEEGIGGGMGRSKCKTSSEGIE